MNLRVLPVLALGFIAVVPRAPAQEPVTVAVRPLEPASADSAGAGAIRDALVAALEADPRVEVENTGQYVIIGGLARANGTTRLDLRIASVATGTMTPLSFVLSETDRAQAVTNAAREVVAKVLELAGRR